MSGGKKREDHRQENVRSLSMVKVGNKKNEEDDDPERSLRENDSEELMMRLRLTRKSKCSC
jgi:hypothetical protein